MKETLTRKELQNFALDFENNIIFPLVEKGFDKYNVFEILNISRQEIRHSDFLAFLMNPNLSGDIGKQFLRNFLSILSKDYSTLNIDFTKAFYGSYENINVSREVAVKDGRIDILVELEIANEKYLILIENKVDSTEHDSQLYKYKQFAKESKYKKHKLILLYLSPYDKVEKTEEEWLTINYSTIYSALCMINTDKTDQTIKTLINDYIKMIRSEFKMGNGELEKMAIEIYKANKKVFDFIYDCKPDWRKETATIIKKFLNERGLILESENQIVNIAFRTTEIANRPDLYFQITLDDMSLRFYKKVNGRDLRINSKGLFGDSSEFMRATEIIKEKTLSSGLKEYLEQALEKTVEENGFISQCLNVLHST